MRPSSGRAHTASISAAASGNRTVYCLSLAAEARYARAPVQEGALTEGRAVGGRRSVMRYTIVALALLLAVSVTSAHAADGAMMTPDELAILLSSNVGADRWSIALSLSQATPFLITGSVFSGPSDPNFIYCPLIDVAGSANDIRHAQFTWRCFESPACRPGSCPGWRFGPQVTLPGSWFLP